MKKTTSKKNEMKHLSVVESLNVIVLLQREVVNLKSKIEKTNDDWYKKELKVFEDIIIKLKENYEGVIVD